MEAFGGGPDSMMGFRVTYNGDTTKSLKTFYTYGTEGDLFNCFKEKLVHYLWPGLMDKTINGYIVHSLLYEVN